MINLRNGGFLLGLLIGALLAALLGVLLLLVLQATRPAPAPLPPPTATLLPPTAPPVAAPTAEPVVTPTPAPAIPEPTAAIAEEPTPGTPVEEPTAAVEFPFPGFPVPIPTPVPPGYNGQEIGVGAAVTTITLKGLSGATSEFPPLDEIGAVMDYLVWNVGEPTFAEDGSGKCTGCRVVLTVGMVDEKGGYQPLDCVFNNAIGSDPTSASWARALSAPQAPGTYGLRLNYYLMDSDDSCSEAMQDVDPSRPAMTLATFQVTP